MCATLDGASCAPNRNRRSPDYEARRALTTMCAPMRSGLTNREVAEQLFVSPHTVSSHLRSVFAKLEINSRLALARIKNPEYEDPNEKKFSLVRRGNGEYLLLSKH